MSDRRDGSTHTQATGVTASPASGVTGTAGTLGTALRDMFVKRTFNPQLFLLVSVSQSHLLCLDCKHDAADSTNVSGKVMYEAVRAGLASGQDWSATLPFLGEC